MTTESFARRSLARKEKKARMKRFWRRVLGVLKKISRPWR